MTARTQSTRTTFVSPTASTGSARWTSRACGRLAQWSAACAVAFFGVACSACSNAPSTHLAYESSGRDGSSSVVGSSGSSGSQSTGSIGATGPSGSSSDSDAGVGGVGPVTDAMAPTYGSYDGPVVDGSCPNLPEAGAWQNISPQGSNYTKTYTGMVAVVVRPDNPAVIYAGADSNGIFKSTDCGANWGMVATGANSAAMKSGRPWSLVIDPVVPDRMYAVEGYGSSGLWMSTNAGVDWNQILTPNITNAFYAGGQITSISMDPTDHTHLVIESHQGADTSAGKCGTYTCIAESTDMGKTWTLLTIPIAWAEDSGVAIVNRKTWIHAVYQALWYTLDEGVTWKSYPAPSSGGMSLNWYEPYIWQTSSGQYMLPATIQGGSGGVFLSKPNDVTSWTAIPNSPQGQMLMTTSTSIIVGAGTTASDATYSIASQSDPTTWTTLPGPKVPTAPSGVGGFPEFVAYDSTHHVFYVSTYTTGLWQAVIQ